MITLTDVTCAAPTADQLCEKLRAYGVARVPGFLSPEETGLVLEETRLATSTLANYRNPYGDCCRFSLEQLPPHLSRSRDLIGGHSLQRLPPQFTHSRDVIGCDILRKTTQTYIGPGSGFMEVVVFTRDCTPDPRAVYGKLHYDRRHQLKFLVYLNDVDESNGAFGCIPGSHDAGRTLFHKGWRRVLGLKTENAREIEEAAAAIPEDSPEYLRVPCIVANLNSIRESIPQEDRLTVEGPAGTLVAFDSHLLHCGGLVAASKERWTLKGHTFAIANMGFV